MSEAGRRCGFVALIGAPNAGKSTLLNRFVGAKVPHDTREWRKFAKRTKV